MRKTLLIVFGLSSALPFGTALPASAQTTLPRVLVKIDFGLWRIPGDDLPPLAEAGTPHQPGAVLFGGTGPTTFHPAIDVRAEAWLDKAQTIAVTGDFRRPFSSTRSFSASADASSPIFRPFIDRAVEEEDGVPVGGPGVAGTIDINEPTSLLLVGAGIRRPLCRSCGHAADLVAGYRMARLSDHLTIATDISITSIVGTSTSQLTDEFRSTATFMGGEIGGAGTMRRGRFVLDWRATLAIGHRAERLVIRGEHTAKKLGSDITLEGGFLAASTNTGDVRRGAISVITDLSVDAGVELSRHCRVFVGYGWVRWTGLERPGEMIDLGFDTETLTPVHPALPNNHKAIILSALFFGVAAGW